MSDEDDVGVQSGGKRKRNQIVCDTMSKIKSREVPNDVFKTPSKIVKHCVSLVPFEQGDVVLDGFSGDGVFYKNYPDFVTKEWTEISEGKNFFTHATMVDWVVSNPPFSKLTEIFHALCFKCKKGFGLIMGVNNLTPGRIQLARDRGFEVTKMHVFRVREWSGFVMLFVLFQRSTNFLNVVTADTTVYSKANNNMD